MTGAGIAASGFGLPDIGLVTQTEMAERARMIVNVLGDIPLIADADTGYGAPANVVRTIRGYESAGAAAIQLEDQAFPKRCGHLPDKELVEAAVFEQRLAAALDSRSDDNFLVVARTDARAPLGLDAAIERGNRYAQAGADIVFIEAPQGIGEIERIAREVQAPLLINLVLGGMTPIESTARLQELGYAVAIHPALRWRAPPSRCWRRYVNSTAATPPITARKPADFFNLVGMAEWAEISEKYRRGGTRMGMTMIEKILARKAGLDSVSVDETVVVDVDMTVLIDLQFATMWIEPLRIHDPDKLAIVMDHAVPAPSIKDAAGGSHARKFAADFGIKHFYDVGRHGICHQVIAENGLARPGEILACTDSHTCAGGAYNTAARGLGPAEIYSIMCTGATWFQIAPTIRYELEGIMPGTVSGKDIFLYIANEYGDAANLNLEYGGSGLGGIPMHDRRTIATQGAEVSADFSTFDADDRIAGISSMTMVSPITLRRI